jgi:hypothetical protein
LVFEVMVETVKLMTKDWLINVMNRR